MNDKSQITTPHKNFENIKKLDEEGVEFWEARELLIILEYTQWRNFLNVIEKAKNACQNSGQDILNHFADTSKVKKVGKGATVEIKDFKLSRYACYLIAQNGDASKEPIALAQTYFATQTRKQELYEGRTKDKKRVLTRDEVKKQNKRLFKTAQDSGVKNFGQFNDSGYKGLYGLTNKQTKERKGIGKDNLLDRAGATELAANLFRITQTDELLKNKLNEGKVIGQNNADKNHFVVGGKVRKAIKDIGGTMPEELPAEEHIKEVEKRVKQKRPLAGKTPKKLEGKKSIGK